MPRYILRRAKPLLTSERSKRARKRLVLGYKQWTDPYPHVLGTRPEKMVYAELRNRNIPFMYQTWFRAELPDFGLDKYYLPDFVLPERKIIIEVQGFYFHSKKEQIEKDAFKQTIYEMLGYKVLAWWDFDIENKLQELFASEPELGWLGGARGGRIITKDQVIRDDAAGIRTANQNRTDYSLQAVRYKGPKSKKARSYSIGI